jgi:hypothetical protein
MIAAAVTAAAPAMAQDSIPILRSSVNSGSERLALYSYTEYLKSNQSLGALNAVNTQMQRLAFPILGGQQLQTGVISRQGRAAPVLSYDDNINGGSRNASFELGGFVFEGSPETIAKESVVVGAEVGGTLRYAYGRGRFVDVSGGLSAVYSPEHDLSKYTASVSVCSKNHVQGWTFVDFCVGAGGQSTDLSDSINYTASTAVTQLFSFGGYDHEATGSLEQNYFEDYDQAQFGAALTTSLGTPGSVTVGFEVGEDVDDTLHLNNRLYASYNTSAFQRPVSFQIERGLYDGGTFFGQDRVDETLTLSLRTRVSEQITIGVTARQNNSSVDFYDYETIGFSLGITGFQF